MPERPFDATILLRSEQTGAAVSAIALTVPSGWSGPPLHHHALDEAFYVLDGPTDLPARRRARQCRPEHAALRARRHGAHARQPK